MDIKEIRNKPLSELNHLLGELRKKMDDLKFKVYQNQLKNVREIRILKKDIAKILTIISEKNKE
ncbi:MAG: 50S ribosomal protein L29 [Candidatus Buchananbacteria bacterium RIFCSPHIGHO2_02_FULL_40_13]|uniref:Large ribosomal subunit protein uL29 n=1 Tax=Candidatus Buchananbacteria bacterium RIFCSPLOWO2_01_FULL_39_33 TaxID=1797543 RepID=A0A1G1YNN6_9BACT|nr:MAG: 50S ribosomal protein L29 [Candidatus Buchananbacteria bacterium RIFCSPHIGHO2_01_FULL_40_35]OGY50576.1 MAG: 50S ribosomal protein L29 [Candidatus Buchananbacteria bacterium RIFCSPHIGHO2_02_FULL_40_13]OGY53047.1 MAG: 50S ribosomal protein L29 [Candidatus Buchananbacteria bacterium RIFCSPLOWO2_01_FULL_39_33]